MKGNNALRSMVVLVAALGAFATRLPGAEQNASGTEAKPTWPGYGENEFARYRVDVQSVTPDTGILTGRVLVYGKPLPPPYTVEAKDSLVFINGVQVSPMPFPPRALELGRAIKDSLASLPAELLAVRDSVGKVISRARRTYDSLYKSVGHCEAVQATAALLKESPYVDSLCPGESPLVYFAGYDSPLLMIFAPPESQAYAPSPPPIPARTAAECAASRALGISSLLADNMVVSFFPPLSRATYTLETLSLVKGILADRSLPLSEKRASVSRLTTHAKWYIANYDPDEWVVVDEF